MSAGKIRQVTERETLASWIAVDQVPRLSWLHADRDQLRGRVLEEDAQVDLQVVVRAEREGLLLADDRHHRLVVLLGVVEAVEHVDGAGPDVAMQTPTSPVNLAWALAQKAVSSLWRVRTNSTWSPHS
jgi:hypothetical protein